MSNRTIHRVCTLGAMSILFAGAGIARADDPAPYLDLLGLIRDFPPESQHPDFLVNPSATPGARSARNIALLLDADDKPVYVGGGKRVTQEWHDAAGNKIAWSAPSAAGDSQGKFGASDDGGIHSAATFAQWFRDVPGINMSRPWPIRMVRESNGTYVFDTNNFHPIDFQLMGNGPDEHNFYFTYEILCTFTAAPGQFVTFTGDDECWIFVNDRLAIDHGGITANRRQHFTLDRLGLNPGQEYDLRFFFAERKQPQSQFRLETNIGSLVTAGQLPVLAAFD